MWRWRQQQNIWGRSNPQSCCRTGERRRSWGYGFTVITEGGRPLWQARSKLHSISHQVKLCCFLSRHRSTNNDLTENQPNSLDECVQKREQEGCCGYVETRSIRSHRRTSISTKNHSSTWSRKVGSARVSPSKSNLLPWRNVYFWHYWILSIALLSLRFCPGSAQSLTSTTNSATTPFITRPWRVKPCASSFSLREVKHDICSCRTLHTWLCNY